MTEKNVVLWPPQGFCLPHELMSEGDGEGATEFHSYEGGGIGEGDGTKDVSDMIENEDQVIEISFCCLSVSVCPLHSLI